MASTTAAPGADGNLVWVDLEMTGLDANCEFIVEIATVVTTSSLELIAEGPNLVVHQPEAVLGRMNPEVTKLHTKSGLIDRIRASSTTLAEAEEATCQFIAAHVPKGKSPLCGNSVWKDKEFLVRYMPRFIAHLHYRVLDVSTVKELVRRWYPPHLHPPKKSESHRALEDIRESISELRFYREHIFRDPSS